MAGEPATIGSGLTETINYDRLRELERFAEIGRLSAGLLHEINNPLTAAILWLEQCNSQISPNIRHVHNSIRLLHRYVEAARQQLLRQSQCRYFRIQSELEQAAHVLDPLARRRGIRLRLASAGGHVLYGDPVKFQQIVANLVRNAMDAYDNCPPSLRYRPVYLDLRIRRDYLVIEVSDQGCGISRAQQKQLFKPFYSTKNHTTRGLGIGLSAVKRFVENDFSGTIRVRSSKLQGTSFIVRFRIASDPRAE